MGKYNLGEVWWTQFPFEDIKESKRRPAVVIDEETIAILAMMVTSKDRENPYSIKIDEWEKAGLKRESWARIDRIIRMDEWRMEKKIGNLSERDLLKIMQLVAEYNTNTYHEFSLLAITNSEGKYLQVYDERWKCWLFPYYRTEPHNKESVDKHASELLKINISTSYVADTTHCKYSESDKVYKRYRHILYSHLISDIPESMSENVFELDNKKYSWKTIGELESDSNTMAKNDDVIAFVKTKCKIK